MMYRWLEMHKSYVDYVNFFFFEKKFKINECTFQEKNKHYFTLVGHMRPFIVIDFKEDTIRVLPLTKYAGVFFL